MKLVHLSRPIVPWGRLFLAVLPASSSPVKLHRTRVHMTHDSGLEQSASLPNSVSKFLGRFQISLPSDFIQKILETFSTRVLLIIFSLATSIIIARSLGPEGRGLYALAITIGTMGVQFTNMGLHSSNTPTCFRH